MFDAKDHEHLRQFCINTTGIDPREENLEGSRTDNAKLTADEKLAREAPFSSSLLITTLSPAGIPLKTGVLPCPAKTFLGVPIEQLDTTKIQQLVIIENGDAFIEWHRFNIPTDLTNAIVIYGGHGTNHSKLTALIGKLPSYIQKIGFYDADPAGLALANGRSLDAIIMPAFLTAPTEATQHFIENFNKKSVLAGQLNKVGRGHENFHPMIKQFYRQLRDNYWAFMQEALAAHNIKLCLHKFN